MKLYDVSYEPIEIISDRVTWPIPVLVAAVVIVAAVLILVLRKRWKKKAGQSDGPEKKDE